MVRSELVELPNGLTMHVPSKAEAGIVFHEVFETEAYLKHGVTVRDGDTVLDVGANVGFFSVFLATRWRNLRILAFEPAPPVFELLEKNARAHARGSDVRLFPYGLSSKRDVLTFRFDPERTFTTSAHGPDVEASARRDAEASRWIRALASDGAKSGWMSPRASMSMSVDATRYVAEGQGGTLSGSWCGRALTTASSLLWRARLLRALASLEPSARGSEPRG
jgi:FkbM family methyltransferase